MSRLKKSDCVIVYTESISHEAMNLTKDLCKKEGIPVSFTKNIGSSLFVARANKLLKRTTSSIKKEEEDNSTFSPIWVV